MIAKKSVLVSARTCRFDQPSLRKLGEELPASEAEIDRLLKESVEARDEIAFTNLLLAALDSGRRVDARHLVDGGALLPDPTQLVVAARHCSGEVARALVDAVERGHMGWERDAVALLFAAIWCREHRDGALPEGLIPAARTLARRTRSSRLLQAPLVALYDIVQDETLQSLLVDTDGILEVARRFRDDLLKEAGDSVLGAVPDQVQPPALGGYTIRRAVARVGRNDPCPCGSGRKYKKCCLQKDQERLERSSDVAGVTLDELRENPEPHLTCERIRDMRSFELARLDPSAVAEDLLPDLIERLTMFDEHEAVVRAFEQVGCTESLEWYWNYAISHISRGMKKELVERLVSARGDSSSVKLPLSARLLLADERTLELLDNMEAEARTVLELPGSIDAVDLAHELLSSRLAAVGILVSRGVIAIANHLDAEVLLETLLEARDRLNLPPGDPIEDLFPDLFVRETGFDADESEKHTKAREELEKQSRKIRNLRRELDRLNRKLADQTRPTRSPSPDAAAQQEQRRPETSPEEARTLEDLRERVALLKSELKQRHAERNQLRRDLVGARKEIEALAQEKAAEESADRAAQAAEDELLLAEEPQTTHPVRIPVFPTKFLDRLAGFPLPVKRATLRLVGKLAAGDADAFRGSRRLKISHESLRQRVGIGHRLLFRADEDTLQLLDLVNRQDFERSVKKLSSG